MRRKNRVDANDVNVQERVIEKSVRRCAKVVKGGRRFSFSAMVVVGDGHGVIGEGSGKARDVPSAVEKAGKNARKELERVSLRGDTIPHSVVGKFGASRILLRPAAPGTGVIACSSVRAVLELAGVRNILTKSMGSTNPLNLVKATIDGLRRLRTRDEIAALRGVDLK